MDYKNSKVFQWNAKGEIIAEEEWRKNKCMFDNRGGIKFLYLCSNFSAPGIIGLYGIYGEREEREEGGGWLKQN